MLRWLTSRFAGRTAATIVGGDTYATIGEAIRNASPGAKISVKPGTYRESLTIDKPMEIFSDGPVDQTIVESETTTSGIG